jgi:hypothetical protein
MVTVKGSHPGAQRYGFELTSENGSGQKKGTFTVSNPTTNQLVNAQATAITHTGSGITPANDSITWSFSWTAPPAGTGNVTFFAAINSANGNGNTSGDVIYLTNHTISEEIITSAEEWNLSSKIDMYPNPASGNLQFNLPSGQTADIHLFNLNGRLVKSFYTSGNESVQVEDMERGVYLVQIKTESKTFVSRLVLI